MTTIVIGNNTGNTAGVSADAAFYKNIPTTNEGSNGLMYLIASTTGTGRATVKFTGLPSGLATVNSATLTIMSANTVGATCGIEARKLLSPFVESEVTWNNRSSGNAWNVAGVLGGSDVDATVVATGTVPASAGTFTMSGAGFNALVQGWMDGSITNHGILLNLISDTSAGNTYPVGAKEYTDGSRIYLTVNYDAGPSVSSITSSTTAESSSIVFTVTLSAATTSDTVYAYSWGGTATSADYTQTLTTAMCTRTGGASGNVTVSGTNITAETGVSAFTITVPVTNDTTDEDSETIVLTVGGTASTGGTITDDDAPPVVTFSDGVESFGVVTCVATLGAVSGKAITFGYATANGTKTAGTHYTAATGTVTFNPGDIKKTITANTL